jgi:hypothetical protein
MYGELKLAFFIYLWYPKTKVKEIFIDSNEFILTNSPCLSLIM